MVDEVVDIGFILTAFAAGKFRRQEVAALPFEAETAILASNALWSLYQKGLTAAEFDAVRPLGFWTFPNAAIHSREPIKTLDDFRGKKISPRTRSPPRSSPRSAPRRSASGPTRPIPPSSAALSTARLCRSPAWRPSSCTRSTRHHLDVALGSDPALLIINRKRYDALPAKAKAAIDKHSNANLSAKFGLKTQEQWQKSRDVVRERVSTLTPEQEAEWKKRLAPIAAEWAQGVPDGAKVLDDIPRRRRGRTRQAVGARYGPARPRLRSARG